MSSNKVIVALDGDNIESIKKIVRELKSLIYFDEIIHVAPFYNNVPPKSYIQYNSSKINYVKLKPAGGNGFINADESAKGLIARIDQLNIENTGSFWHANGDVLPW